MRVIAQVMPGLTLLASLSACTVIQPIPDPTPGFSYFSSNVTPKPEPLYSDCERDPRAPDCFYGGMGELMASVERRAQGYRILSRDVVNTNALYNTLLYPAGAAVIYEKLRGAPNRNFLLPAAVAAAVHGIMTGGIVDRDKRYLAGAVALRCLQGKYGVWLYRKAEITGNFDSTTSLSFLRKELSTAVGSYRDVRATIIAEAKPKPGGGARDAIAAARMGPPSSGADSRSLFHAESAVPLQLALDMLGKLDEFRGELDAAPMGLAQDAQEIEQQVEASLGQAARPLLDPFAVGSQLLGAAKNFGNANAGTTPLDADFVPAVLAGLDANTRARVLAFSAVQGQQLRLSFEHAQAFLNSHARKTQSSNCAALVQVPQPTTGATP